MDGNIDELYDNMKNTYPDIYNCVYNIDQYLYKEFKKSCTSNELLYLMIHVTPVMYTRIVTARALPQHESAGVLFCRNRTLAVSHCNPYASSVY